MTKDRSIKLYQRNPDTGKRVTVVKNGIAIKDYWVQDFAKNRHFIKKGTQVNELGLPIKEDKTKPK